MKIIIVMISVLILSISNVYCKLKKEHEKRIEFIKKCLENKDNIENFIKNSDYYDEDCFEKDLDLNKSILEIENLLKKYPSNNFIFTGFNTIYISILNQYIFEYNVQMYDKYGIVFGFKGNEDESCLCEISNTFIGELETTAKFLFITKIIQSFKISTDSALIENFFLPDNNNLSSNNINNFKLHKSNFEKFKKIILMNSVTEIEMIHDLSGWIYASNDTHFYHYMYIKISENCILKFEYRYDEKKKLWYYYSFEQVDSYP
jgi:hypothetical protein